MTLPVVMTVRVAALATFRAFETQAARIMARYGGAIARMMVVPAVVDQDVDLAAIRPLRGQSVVGTDCLIGEDGPDHRGFAQ
ncbi:MAG: hypothetical protein H7338_11145 [Candidatus Sericytochromatia bacterium]|nr:hypothetical protein [Candidatus Sericytochromatia bacterium]